MEVCCLAEGRKERLTQAAGVTSKFCCPMWSSDQQCLFVRAHHGLMTAEIHLRKWRLQTAIRPSPETIPVIRSDSLLFSFGLQDLGSAILQKSRRFTEAESIYREAIIHLGGILFWVIVDSSWRK